MKKLLPFLLVAFLAVVSYALWMRHHFSVEQVKWKALADTTLATNDSLLRESVRRDSIITAAELSRDSADAANRRIENTLIVLRAAKIVLVDSLKRQKTAADSVPVLVELVNTETARADTAEKLAEDRKTVIAKLSAGLDTAKASINDLRTINAKLASLIKTAPLEPEKPHKWLGILSAPSKVIGGGAYYDPVSKRYGGALFIGLGWAL